MKEQSLALAVAKIKLAEIEAKSRQKTEGVDAFLFAALESCLEAEAKLPEELAKLDQTISEVKSEAPDDPKTKIRVDRLYYEKDLLQWQVESCGAEARRRIKHLRSIVTKDQQELEREKCRADTQYWFDNYAWTVDPRNPILWAMPFTLFPFQRDYLTWVERLIFKLRASGTTDKSRDQGVSWEISAIFTKHWLMPAKGTSFHALVGSITAGEVDTLGDPSSIFEKIRLQLRFQPHWLLPKAWDGSIPLMRAVNHENGSTIMGETANEDFGRSGRYTVIWFDEFAAFELAEAAATAASQSSKCKIYTWTPKGKQNFAARLLDRGTLHHKSLHWKLHPWKDERWYKAEALDMTDAMVAQELDIDYNASQPGKVYTNYDETYHVVTYSELFEALPEWRGRDGVLRVPEGYSIGMGQDWGASEDHANIMGWFAVAPEGTRTKQGIDISGSVFIIHEWKAPINSTVAECARYIKPFEAKHNIEVQYVERLISHERRSERATYEKEQQLYFTAWDTDYNAGIAQVRDYLEVSYFHEPHPFREITRRREYPAERPIMGRPRLYFVSVDEQGRLKRNYTLGRWDVSFPVDGDGLFRARSEIQAYHYPKSETGKAVRQQRPEKKYDDMMDVIRCVAATFFPPIMPMSKKDQLESKLPASLRETSIRNETPKEMARSWLARESFIREHVEPKVAANNAATYRDSLYERAVRNTK
jgi:hypothetical protein